MARTADSLADFTSSAHSPFHAVSTFFKSLAKAMSVNAGMQSRMERITKLNALSDDELKELGIERDRIVHHVFRDIYYV